MAKYAVEEPPKQIPGVETTVWEKLDVDVRRVGETDFFRIYRSDHLVSWRVGEQTAIARAQDIIKKRLYQGGRI